MLLLFGNQHTRAGIAFGCPANTARGWWLGKRRMPVPMLERLHAMLQGHAAEAWSVHAAIGTAIEMRRGEPSRSGLGFRAIDPRTGMDKRWRGGRSRKPKPG